MLFDYRTEPEIPDGWRIEPLENLIADIGDGGTPPRSDPSNFGGGIAWAVIEDIRKDITSTKETLSERGVLSSNAKIWPARSVVVSTGATIGRIGVARVPLATKQGITGIVPNKDTLLADYLAAVLMMGTSVLERFSQGSTFKEIRPPTLKKLRLRVPNTVDEQTRIAAVLDTVDEAIAKTEAVNAKLRQVRAGLLQDLLTRGLDAHGQLRDPIAHPEQFQDSPLGRIPRAWDVKLARQLCSVITKGTTPPASAFSTSERSVRYLRVDNLTFSGDLDLSASTLFIDRATHEGLLGRSIVLEGDVLMNIVGPPLGKVSVVPAADNGWNVNQAIAVFRTRADISPFFLSRWLFSSGAQAWFNREAKRTSGQVNLTLEMCAKLPIPLPPPEEIALISELFRTADSAQVAEEKYVSQLRALSSGLATDLLTGRVRVPRTD